MDPDSMILKLFILALLIACNAFFAMSEIAIVTFNDAKLRKLAEDGDKRARRLLRLVEEPSRFLSTIQVGVTLSGFLASASAAEDFSDSLGQWLSSWSGLPMQTADTTPARAPEDAPALVKKIGKTTYKVRVHFSQTSTETMSDKIKRMLKNEIQQM